MGCFRNRLVDKALGSYTTGINPVFISVTKHKAFGESPVRFLKARSVNKSSLSPYGCKYILNSSHRNAPGQVMRLAQSHAGSNRTQVKHSGGSGLFIMAFNSNSLSQPRLVEAGNKTPNNPPPSPEAAPGVQGMRRPFQTQVLQDCLSHLRLRRYPQSSNTHPQPLSIVGAM